jgi:hypothetical protein
MRPLRKIKYLSICILLGLFGCVEPYNTPDISGNPDFLVIDSFLNGSDQTCQVRLTKAVSIASEVGYAELDDNISNPIEVRLEDDHGNSFVLSKVATGRYEVGFLPLVEGYQYRINVKVPSRGNYFSDFVDVKQTPAIEEVFFEAHEDELRIMVNTADASGQSNYYRWTWTETFEYTSPYPSYYKIVNGEAFPREESEMIHRCYRTDESQNIMVASSTDLASDVIRNFLVQRIERTSQKLQHRYSIDVKQMALSEEAYTYWLNLYKTTENVGGLFDPMPGEVRGNFRSATNASELVIGFFSASVVQSQRIFITPDDLPVNYVLYRLPYCPYDTILNEDLPFANPTALLTTPIYSQGGPPKVIGYGTSWVTCVDCRKIHQGVTEKPSFWP